MSLEDCNWRQTESVGVHVSGEREGLFVKVLNEDCIVYVLYVKVKGFFNLFVINDQISDTFLNLINLNTTRQPNI